MSEWREVVEALPGLVWTTSPTGEPEWCGSSARAWFSDPDRWLDALHPEERDACRQGFQACLEQGEPYRAEHRLQNTTGEFAPFRCEARAVRDREQRITRWLWTAADWSEVTEARAHRQRVQTALADSKVGIWLHDLRKNELVHSRVDGERDPVRCIQRGMVASESERVLAAYRQALADPSFRYHVEFRALEPYGAHWRLARGRLLHSESGEAEWFVGASVDVSAVRRTEEQLELATKLSGVYIWSFDLENGALGRATFVNVWESLGYPDPGAVDFATAMGRVILEEDQPAVMQAVLACLDGSAPSFEHEYRIRHADGSVRWNLGRGIVARNEALEPLRFIGTSVDITDLKASQAEAARHKERLELALSGSKACTWEFEPKNGVLKDGTSWFANLVELVGHERSPDDDFLSLHERIIPTEDQDPFLERIQRFLEGPERRYEGLHRVRHKDGTEHWHLARGVCTREPSTGQAIRLTGTSVDITEQKRLEQELSIEKARLELALKSSGLAVFDIELAGEDLDHKKATLFNVWEALGYDGPIPDADPGKVLLFAEDVPQDRARLMQYLRHETPTYQSETRHLHRDGSTRWKLIRGISIDDEQGRPQRLIGSLVDITERKAIEAELERARERAEAANREKDEFLAHVSHELRTPMNAILAMTELALDTPQSEHQAQLLSTVQSAAGNLVGIIDDLLDFSKITAGKLALDPREVSLRATVSDTVRALVSRAERKGLSLGCAIAPDVPDVVLADDGRLRQVLMNLLGNALKFTSHGEVQLDVRLAATEPTAVLLTFVVRDTGIGISREHQRSIFGAFVQGDASTTRKFGGTGLGLTISLQLVELMGGTIAVDSEPGHGSTFSFTVRFGRCARRDDVIDRTVERTFPPTPLTSAIPPRVLVAEDNELNVAVLRELLDQRGYAADFARDGREAWELAQADAHDLLLLDLHMPEMDGFEVVRAIRDRERERGGRLPIIALTARSSARDRELALAAGMDDFLAKPIKVSGLWAAVDRALERCPPSPDRVRTRKLVDRATLLRVCGGRAAVFERLRSVFGDSLPGQMARGRAALDERDFGRLLDAAHRLHGTLSTFSSVAGTVALRLEDAAQGKEVARCRELVATLEAMCASLIEETRELAFEDVSQ